MDKRLDLERRIADFKRKLKAREGRAEYQENVRVLKQLLVDAEEELALLKAKPDG